MILSKLLHFALELYRHHAHHCCLSCRHFSGHTHRLPYRMQEKNIVHDCFAMMVPFPMLLQAISSSMKNNCLSYVPGPTRGAQRQQKQCSRKEKLSRYCELVNSPKTAPVFKSLLYHSNEHRSCQSATNDRSRSSCQQSGKFEEHHGGQRPSLADSQFCHSQEEVPKEVERKS